MVHDTASGPTSKIEFIKQLKEGSSFLDSQREDISSLWESSSDIEIATFYETKKTPTVSKVGLIETKPMIYHTLILTFVSKSSSDAWTRDGENVQMVNRNSAMLFWPFEHRIPVESDHTDIVKFPARGNSTYGSVVAHMTKCMKRLKDASGE
jgi:hypothetical protein